MVEATIPDMQKAMAEGRVTAEDLVKQYLIRIATYENVINATISVNPNPLAKARALDEERKAGNVRGPMHGIPVALKDNIQATGMPSYRVVRLQQASLTGGRVDGNLDTETQA